MESGGLLGNLMLHLRTQNEKERISEMKKKKKKRERDNGMKGERERVAGFRLIEAEVL